MPRRIAIALLAAASALALAGCVGPPIEQQEWTRARSEHFEVISNADPALARQVALDLERFRVLILSVTGIGEVEVGVPFVVYVFRDSASFDEFRPRRIVQGFMRPTAERNYLTVNAEQIDSAIAIAFHEFTHMVSYSNSVKANPTWYEEGLAEMVSSVRFVEGGAEIGRIPRERAHWLRFGSGMSLRRVMTAHDVMRWSDRAASTFYAQAWALTHFMHTRHLVAEGPPLKENLVDYLRRAWRGDEPDAAFQEAFGQTFEELEPEWLRFVSNAQFAYTRVPLDESRIGEVESSPLPDVERFLLLGDLAFTMGEPGWERAEGLYQLGVERDPTDALARASLARVRAARGNPAASAELELLEAGGSPDARVLRRTADGWIATQGGGPDAEVARRERAARLYERALERSPNDLASLLGLARALGRSEADHDRAIRLLRRARRRAPGFAPVALELARRRAERGQLTRARDLLTRVVRLPHASTPEGSEGDEVERLAPLVGFDPSDKSTRHLNSHLEIQRPEPETRVEGLTGWIDVAGRGGLTEIRYFDVLVAIDQSGSTFLASGVDVDGDGVTGRRNDRIGSTDRGDSILAAELIAARRLVEQLNPATTRVGLVGFSERAHVISPMGEPTAALEALDALRLEFLQGGTSIGNVMVDAITEFARVREPDRLRHRTLILLSDGQPNVPTPSRGRDHALEVAKVTGGYGIRVYAFAIGEEAIEESETFQRIAELTGGRFVPVPEPASVISKLADLSLTGLEDVQIWNRSTDAPARAVRLMADGSFDGMVELAPGMNTIEIVARVQGRGELRAERRILFERPLRATPAHQEAARHVLEKLRDRTAALELQEEMRRTREAQLQERRELAIEVLEAEAEPGTGPAGGASER